MLQQTQVATVIPYYQRWMSALPDVASLSRCPEAKLLKMWEGLGYYTRVRNLQKAAGVICAKHGGIFPRDHASVLDLPGIGPYTAGAICSIAFNQPAPIVDGNVARVLSRVFTIAGDVSQGRASQRVWKKAGVLVQAAMRKPDPDNTACGHFNQSLMELGAMICTPAAPRCAECPLATACKAFRSGRVARYPARRVRPKSVEKRLLALVLKQGTRVFVRQRPSGTHNARFWEFPSIEINPGEMFQSITALARGEAGASEAQHIGTVRHCIMHYRIVLEAYQLEAGSNYSVDGGRWCSMEELKKLPVATAHRKVLGLLDRFAPKIKRS